LQVFKLCWNCHGQFQFLKALLISHLLLGFKEERFGDDDKQEWVNWLKNFEQAHHPHHRHDAPCGYISEPNHITNPYNFENPYFSGLKPLHLGMVLSECRGSEKLI